ncbi:probable E3 SUMO-protein ligase RNF212 [Diadema setosum]|uniref:probable E3 SUMO-protein ligase RNF212 n=1 Tax=Diadema setosum TaxID=31175 RepID=UPI003B3B5E05
MDWVHCNTCFRQPAGSGPKFALTNCGHIYCSDCVGAGTKEKCRMCGNSCTTMTLSSQMKPDVELFFTDPAEIVKKQQKQLITVLDFQKNHRQRLTAHRREVQVKHISMLESAKNRMKEMECEINRLREENKKLRSLIGGSPGPSKISQRPSSGGRTMRTSQASLSSSANWMAFKTPSPSKNRTSPFSKSSQPTTPNPMDVSRGSPQVNAGPARYSVRTPPSGGRMGTIISPIVVGGSQLVVPKSAHVSRHSGSMASAETPGRQSPRGSSPLHLHRSSNSSADHMNVPGPGGDATGRKQIQLLHTPHTRTHMLATPGGREGMTQSNQH